MPCDNCQKIITQAAEDPRIEEEIIKDLTNCQKCSEEIINRCHTCYWPIYKKELIYESSRDSSSGDNFWILILKRALRIENQEKIIQCDWCL